MAERIQIRVNGRELTVKSGDILGRGRHADVAVEGSMVSRKHAQFHRGPGGWFVTDLGSSNGVFDRAGSRTEYLPLPAGLTRFTLGPTSVGIEIDVTIPEAMATPPTTRVGGPPARPVEPHAEPERHLTGRVAPPVAPPAQPAAAEPPGFAPPRPLGQPAATATAVTAPQMTRGAASIRAGVSIRGEDLTVVVGDGLTILESTTLSLPAGSMTAIVGPSGCGKSTLANLLSGRSTPTTGTVTIDGQPMTPTVRSRIGVVPQYDAVHEQLTVSQALGAAARLRLPSDTTDDEIDEAVRTTAAVLDLDERLDTRVAKLSGGQKKRVSVGYELVSEPIMMVLDEPTSGLDPGLEQDLIAELRDLADRGTTTVLVTHSPDAAMEADLVIVMAPGGHLTYLGPPDEVLGHIGVDDWADVFSRLTGETATQWADHYVGTPQHQRWVVEPPPPTAAPIGLAATPAGRPTVDRSWLGDFSVMTGRYVRSITSDWRSVLLLCAQAPVLGLLFAAVLSRQVFIEPLIPRTNAREFVLACVLAMVWIGASNSVREIVKERRTFLRERAVGVSASALVASRWAVLAVITIIQAVTLYYTATSRQQQLLTDGVLLGHGPAEMMIAFALVGLASVGIGLLLSALVRDSNKAMAILPVVLIPIVLFSGLLIPTVGRAGVEQISWLNPVQWGSSGAAVVADVLANEGCDPDDLQSVIQQALLGRTISCSNSRWQPTAGTQAINLGVAGAQVVALILLSFVAADRSTRNLRS